MWDNRQRRSGRKAHLRFVVLLAAGLVAMSGCDTFCPTCPKGPESPSAAKCPACPKCRVCPVCPESSACPEPTTCLESTGCVDPPFIKGIKTAMKKVPGVPVEAKVERRENRAVYHIQITDRAGKTHHVYVDPDSGKVLDVGK